MTPTDAAPAMVRTLRARDDLDWLPPSFKAIRWTVAGTLWTGMAAAVGAALVFAKHGFFVYGKGIAVLAAGGYYAGDRAARAVLRRRLARLAHGAVDLSGLQREADGELVHVRGKVRAKETLPGLLHPEAKAVYRRVVFSVGGVRFVHEAAVDFFLADATGEMALVEVQGARLVAVEPKRNNLDGADADKLEALAVEAGAPPPRANAKRKRRDVVRGGELLLSDGDEVELVGYKNRSVDPTVEMRLARDTPMRATLRSGRELPLVIAPVASAAAPPESAAQSR